MVLLDTCVLIWLETERKKISRSARELMASHPEATYLSPITAFELAWTARRRRIALPLPPQEWLADMSDKYGLLNAGLDYEIACRAAALDLPHGDPCDRIIAATAAVRGWTLVTPDPLLAACEGVRVAW